MQTHDGRYTLGTRFLLVLTAGLWLAAGTSARAALLAYESFEGLTAGESLHGKGTGTDGFGWSGTWSVNAGTATLANISLSYSNGDLTLSGGDRAVRIGQGSENSAGWLNPMALRNLESAITLEEGAVFYISFLFRTVEDSNDIRFMCVGAGRTGPGTEYRNAAALVEGNWGIGSVNLAPYQTTHLIVGKVETVFWNNAWRWQPVSVFLNPDSETEPTTPSATRSEVNAARNSNWSAIEIFARWAVAGSSAEAYIDEIRVGETWQDVVAVPLPDTFTITASAGDNGSIDPSGAVEVDTGEDQLFDIEADMGYEVADVLVNGSSVGAVTSYTFVNVLANQTIHATFQTPDTEPPSVPQDLTATAVSFARVDLSWTASTDNRGVSHYVVKRDETEIGTSTTIGYIDASVAAETTYSYTVYAVDTSDNASGESDPASATAGSKPVIGATLFKLDFDTRHGSATGWQTITNDELRHSLTNTVGDTITLLSNGDPSGATLRFAGSFSAEAMGAMFNAFATTDWDEASRDMFLAGHYASNDGLLTIAGLPAGRTYRIEVCSAATVSFDPNRYKGGDLSVNGTFADTTPNGENWDASLDGYYGGHILVWENVALDGSGNIVLTASPLPEVNSVPVNAMTISEIQPSGTLLLLR